MGTREKMLEVHTSKRGDVLLITIRGRLDTLNTRPIQEAVVSGIEDKYVKVLFNLSGLTYLSSAGIKAFIATDRLLKSLSGKLVLYGLSKELRDIMIPTGIEVVLTIAKDENEGLKLLQ